MGTSFEDILNRMRNAPHNGIPKVTNPKVPTKVERDAAAFAERVKNSPIIPTSSGSQLDEILKRMRDSSHGGMVYADPNFASNIPCLSQADLEAYDIEVEAFIEKLNAEKAKKNQKPVGSKPSKHNIPTDK
jgi:hypothetical protein